MVLNDEGKLIIKFLRENKTINLEQSEKYVACNISKRTVNAFHLVMPVYFDQMKEIRISQGTLVT